MNIFNNIFKCIQMTCILSSLLINFLVTYVFFFNKSGRTNYHGINYAITFTTLLGTIHNIMVTIKVHFIDNALSNYD